MATSTIYPRVMLKTAKLETNKVGNNIIRIKFPFDRETLDQVKTIPGRKYKEEDRSWSCGCTIENIELLKRFNFNISDELSKIVLGSKIDVNACELIKIPNLKYSLYPYQNIGVSFIEAKNGRALIADEQGLGKTVIALSWLVLRMDVRPVLLIVPSSLKLNWARETNKWVSTPRIQILSGQTPKHITGQILIINYDILPYWTNSLNEYGIQCVIADEVHKIKNAKARRTKAFYKIIKSVPNLIGLSGTPIENRPMEIYNIAKMINPASLPDRFTFGMRFCAGKNNGYGWDFSGATNTQELHEILTSTIMIRRLKKDVLTDLPEKTFAIVPIEIDNRKEYTRAKTDFISYVESVGGIEKAISASNAEVLTQMSYLKQLAVKGKMKQCVEWIEDFLESDQKLVVFVEHKWAVEILENHFKSACVKVVGGLSNAQKQKAVDTFQQDPTVRLFIGNEAAEVGLTLTAASNLAHIEYPMVPGKYAQRCDRVHRITQKYAVTIYNLIAVETIDEETCSMLDRKLKVTTGILDGVEVESSNLLMELYKNL